MCIPSEQAWTTDVIVIKSYGHRYEIVKSLDDMPSRPYYKDEILDMIYESLRRAPNPIDDYYNVFKTIHEFDIGETKLRNRMGIFI